MISVDPEREGIGKKKLLSPEDYEVFVSRKKKKNIRYTVVAIPLSKTAQGNETADKEPHRCVKALLKLTFL